MSERKKVEPDFEYVDADGETIRLTARVPCDEFETMLFRDRLREVVGCWNTQTVRASLADYIGDGVWQFDLSPDNDDPRDFGSSVIGFHEITGATGTIRIAERTHPLRIASLWEMGDQRGDDRIRPNLR